jgi:hypothetical protein
VVAVKVRRDVDGDGRLAAASAGVLVTVERLEP